MNLQDLGFTQEELQQRVIDQCVQAVLSGTFHDEEGNEFKAESVFARTLQKQVSKQVDDTINALAEKHVLPNVHSYVENLSLQATNQWGEARGTKVSFIEYLTQRAEAYLQEKVDFQGKAKGQDSYSWNGTQTRLAHMVHQHLHYSIENAMKQALTIANSNISKGIEATVKEKLAEITAQLSVNVKVGK